MAFNEWNTSGELTYTDNDVLTAANLNDSIDEVTPPIGAVVAWLKSFTGVPATLPTGWVECNGQALSDADSPLNGQTIPDLNGSSGTERFLRGQTTSGGTGGSETHTHPITDLNVHDTNTGSGYAGFNSNTTSRNTSATSTLPSYYEVVWIMRVK